jgi:hypothetical protein
LDTIITHQQFRPFDLSYCITTHVSQGSTYDFPYSIYEYQYFDEYLLYTAMSRSTQMIINLKYQQVIFIKSLTIMVKAILVQLLTIKPDGDNIKKRVKICHDIGPLRHKELKILNL